MKGAALRVLCRKSNMLDKIGTFLLDTVGLDFFTQYFFTKGLDKIGRYLGNKQSKMELKTELKSLFETAYDCLCKKNGWENNIDAVYDLLKKNNISIDKIKDADYVENFFREILGPKFDEYYNINITEQWKECLNSSIMLPEFENIYKIFTENRIEYLETKINNFAVSEEIWKEREDAERRNNRKPTIEMGEDRELEEKKELELAIETMEVEEYKEAIDKFRKLNVKSTEEQVKYLCYYYEGYCYSLLARNIDGYSMALRLFQKAEKIVDISRDDVVLLYRNIALLYTYIGREEEKINNYKKANEYFQKVLIYANDDEEYFIIDVILHIARNFMDMCDEVPMSEVDNNLSLAMVQMIGVLMLHLEDLSEEHSYILFHNMGKALVHFAEKEFKMELLEPARQLYFKVLGLKCVQRDKERLATTNINLGIAYQYDSMQEIENLNKALVHYQMALEIYNSSNNNTICCKALNVQLDMAEVYSRLYMLSEEEVNFEKAEKFLCDVLNHVSVMPVNSLYLRLNLSRMKLYYRRVVLEKNEMKQENWIKQAEKISEKIDVILTMTNYEKYEYTYYILKFQLNIYKIDDSTDINTLISAKKELQNIANKTERGNTNLYKKALETADEYEKAIRWRLKI